MQKTIIELQKEFDPKNVFGSIKLFSKQCESGYEAGKNIILSETYKEVKNILVLGMGGSALPAHILKSQNAITLPFEIWSRYGLPQWVNKDTLIIAMSYSGSTEETLDALELAKNRDAKIVVITTGGALAQIGIENNFPTCLLNEETNPCKQPRFGLGSSIFALLGILENLSVCTEKVNIKNIVNALAVVNEEKLITLAQTLTKKSLVIVSAEHLGQAAHFLQNQFNETSKTFAVYHELPELNHHLLEGLKFPEINKENLVFIFLTSKKYSERILKRVAVTKEVIESQGIKTIELPFEAEDTFAETVLALQAGEYISYYIGLLHEVDPSEIPFVIHLKEKLK